MIINSDTVGEVLKYNLKYSVVNQDDCVDEFKLVMTYHDESIVIAKHLTKIDLRKILMAIDKKLKDEK